MNKGLKFALWGLAAVVLIMTGPGVSSSRAGIVAKQVEYSAKGEAMQGYLAYNEGIQGRRPAILVVPEWWGVNDYVRKRARMLAELGYTALAVDMYGKGKLAMNPEEAGKLSSEVKNNKTLAEGRFMAALEFLKGQPTVDPQRVAAIGYCFGGGVVLNMARWGADLKGVVSFHGDLTTVDPAKAGGVKAKILILTGGDDSFVPPKRVDAFQQEMKEAGADFRVIVYPGARHSFTNPEADALGKKFSIPIAYQKEADTKSWGEMKSFLGTAFKG